MKKGKGKGRKKKKKLVKEEQSMRPQKGTKDAEEEGRIRKDREDSEQGTVE